jgi:hypothetical protein
LVFGHFGFRTFCPRSQIGIIHGFVFPCPCSGYRRERKRKTITKTVRKRKR